MKDIKSFGLKKKFLGDKSGFWFQKKKKIKKRKIIIKMTVDDFPDNYIVVEVDQFKKGCFTGEDVVLFSKKYSKENLKEADKLFSKLIKILR